jgi:hypothetical protein
MGNSLHRYDKTDDIASSDISVLLDQLKQDCTRLTHNVERIISDRDIAYETIFRLEEKAAIDNKVNYSMYEKYDDLIRRYSDLLQVNETKIIDLFAAHTDHINKCSSILMSCSKIIENIYHVNERDSLLQSVDTITNERDSLLQSVDTITNERDSLLQSVDTITNERDSLLQSVDTITNERDSLLQSVDTITNERDSLLQSIVESKKIISEYNNVLKVNIENTAKQILESDQTTLYLNVGITADHIIEIINTIDDIATSSISGSNTSCSSILD